MHAVLDNVAGRTVLIDFRSLYRRRRVPGRAKHREAALTRLLTAALKRGFTIYECDAHGTPHHTGWQVDGGQSLCFMAEYRSDAGFLARHVARRTFGWGQSLRIALD